MLSNTETPKYYAEFRDAVIRGDIPVCQEISKEMNRIDQLIETLGTITIVPPSTDSSITAKRNSL